MIDIKITDDTFTAILPDSLIQRLGIGSAIFFGGQLVNDRISAADPISLENGIGDMPCVIELHELARSEIETLLLAVRIVLGGEKAFSPFTTIQSSLTSTCLPEYAFIHLRFLWMRSLVLG